MKMQVMKIIKRIIYVSGMLLLACNTNNAPNNSDFHLDASGSNTEAPYPITEQAIVVTDDLGQLVLDHVVEDENSRLHKPFYKGRYNAASTTTAATVEPSRSYVLASSSSNASNSNVSASSDTRLCAFNGYNCQWNCFVNDDSQSQVTCIPSAFNDDSECHYDNLLIVLQIVDLVCVPDQTFDTRTPVWLRAYGGSGANSKEDGSQGLGGFAQTITSLDDLQAQFGDYDIYFATGSKGNDSDGEGGAATIISGSPPTQTGSDEDLSYSFAMSDIIAVAGGGGAVAEGAADASSGAHAASMRVGYCATSQGQDAGGSDNDASGGFGGGSNTYDEDIINDSDYCSDDMLMIHAIGASQAGHDGIGGKGGGDNGWSNFDELNTYWGGFGDGGLASEVNCSGGGGFGGGGACDGNADLGGGGGGSFAMAPTAVDFDAYDSDSSNYGDGYIEVIFNASPKALEGYCDVSCSGYGDADDNGRYSQAICQPVDLSYDTHECDSLSLTYVIDSLNSMDILSATASSSSSIWLRAYGAAGTNGQDTDYEGAGVAGSGGVAQTVLSLDTYQAKYATDNIYFLLGAKNSGHGAAGAASLVLSSPALYDTEPDINATLLVAGAGGGGGQSVGYLVWGTGGDGGVASSYIADVCSITQGGDAEFVNGGAGGTTLSSDDIAYCDLSSSTNRDFILAKASAGKVNGNADSDAGSDGIGGLGATRSGAANVFWVNNERVSMTWIGSGNGGQGDSGSNVLRASGAGGGGFGGGAGGYSQDADRATGGAGGGSYAASALTTDFDACDTSKNNCGLSKNAEDSDHSGMGYIEIIVNVSSQTSAPDG